MNQDIHTHYDWLERFTDNLSPMYVPSEGEIYYRFPGFAETENWTPCSVAELKNLLRKLRDSSAGGICRWNFVLYAEESSRNRH